MKRVLKVGKWLFPDRFRETKEQESLVERTLLLSQTKANIS
jgi:hypothetical protein